MPEEKVGAALIQKGDLFASRGTTQDLGTVSVIDMTAIVMGTVLPFWNVQPTQFRHPGESRDLLNSFQAISARQIAPIQWIPTFVGMTD